MQVLTPGLDSYTFGVLRESWTAIRLEHRLPDVYWKCGEAGGHVDHGAANQTDVRTGGAGDGGGQDGADAEAGGGARSAGSGGCAGSPSDESGEGAPVPEEESINALKSWAIADVRATLSGASPEREESHEHGNDEHGNGHRSAASSPASPEQVQFEFGQAAGADRSHPLSRQAPTPVSTAARVAAAEAAAAAAAAAVADAAAEDLAKAELAAAAAAEAVVAAAEAAEAEAVAEAAEMAEVASLRAAEPTAPTCTAANGRAHQPSGEAPDDSAVGATVPKWVLHLHRAQMSPQAQGAVLPLSPGPPLATELPFRSAQTQTHGSEANPQPHRAAPKPPKPIGTLRMEELLRQAMQAAASDASKVRAFEAMLTRYRAHPGEPNGPPPVPPLAPQQQARPGFDAGVIRRKQEAAEARKQQHEVANRACYWSERKRIPEGVKHQHKTAADLMQAGCSAELADEIMRFPILKVPLARTPLLTPCPCLLSPCGRLLRTTF